MKIRRILPLNPFIFFRFFPKKNWEVVSEYFRYICFFENSDRVLWWVCIVFKINLCFSSSIFHSRRVFTGDNPWTGSAGKHGGNYFWTNFIVACILLIGHIEQFFPSGFILSAGQVALKIDFFLDFSCRFQCVWLKVVQNFRENSIVLISSKENLVKMQVKNKKKRGQRGNTIRMQTWWPWWKKRENCVRMQTLWKSPRNAD